MDTRWKIDGGRLLVRDGARLPQTVCLRTGRPTTAPSVRTIVQFTRMSDALATAVLLVGGLIYGRTYVARIRHGLAGWPRTRRTIGTLVIVMATLALVVGAVVGHYLDTLAMLIALMAFIVGTVLGVLIRGHEVQAIGMHGDWLVLDCTREVLAALERAETESPR